MASETVNLKTLSERLGLSQTTVSRALNGFPEVNEKTRDRVIEAARRFNYRPSANAASLATGKAWTIGHVIPLTDHRMINPHFSDFIEGAGQTYADQGYDMLIRPVRLEDQEKTYRELAGRNRIDGAIVHGPLIDDPRIALLQEIGLPFVVHGRSDSGSQDFSWLDVNNKAAFYRATEFLIDLGHTRIALLNGLEIMNFAKRRRQGFEDAMADRGLPTDETLITSADMVEPYGYHTALKMLERSYPPSAFLASSILVAIGIARAIADKGLLIGRDVSVLAFDDCLSFLSSANASTETTYFTAMRSSIREAGVRTAQILIDAIHSRGEPVQELWEAQLVVGRTTGPNRN